MRTTLIIPLAVGLSTPAAADILTVDDDGSAQYTSIQAAIDASSDGDVISIAEGTYQEANVDPGGRAIHLIGEVDAGGAPLAVIDGTGNHRCLRFISGETASTVIENLVVTNGSSFHGGGINCVGSSPRFVNCIITDNRSNNSKGGGLYVDDGRPTLVDCVVSFNRAAFNGTGGGVYATATSGPTFTDCLFEGNQAEGGNLHNTGGAIWCGGGELVVSGCTFRANSARHGLGIHAFDGASLTVTASVFEHHKYQYADGGGINLADSTCTLVDSRFESNDSQNGSAIHLRGSVLEVSSCVFEANGHEDFTGNGQSDPYATIDADLACTITIAASTFHDNRGRFNGGIEVGRSILALADCAFTANWGGHGGALGTWECDSVEIVGCSFDGNSSTSGGGAIQTDSSDHLLIEDCDFANNTSTRGGALELDGYVPATIQRSRFEGNSAPSGGACVVGADASFTECVFEGNTADQGGAVYIAFSRAASLIDCRISNNTALEGGGIFGVYWSPGYHGNGVATLTRTDFCGNAPEHISGEWSDPGSTATFSPTCPDICPADLDGDGVTGGQDLGLLFVAWGPCSGDCPADLNDDGVVDGQDLGLLFTAWGDCD